MEEVNIKEFFKYVRKYVLVVIMPIVKQFNKMLYRKLVYTGITRSKKKLYIVGDVNALKKAVDNTDSDIRRTTIKEFLINGIK